MKDFEQKWNGKRVEKQQSARHSLMEKWQQTLQNRAQKDNSKPQAPLQPKKAMAPQNPSPPPPTYGKSNLKAYKDASDEARAPCLALRRLTDVYLEASHNASAHVVLTWPGGLRPPLMAHIFATAELWACGNKRGVRGGYFPAKSNTFFSLNHVQLSRSSLMHWAQELIESPHTKNPKVTCSLPEKDSIYFRIGNTKEVRPCVNEVLPHFEQLADGEHWNDYSGDLLEHLLTKVRRRTEKSALKSQLAVLGNPMTAPDAIFALGYRLSKSGIKKALHSMKKHGAPNVFLIDASRTTRISIEGWRNKLLGFLDAFYEVFPSSAPGLVVLTDDPRIGWQLREAILQRSQKALGKAVKVLFNPIACTRHDDGLIPDVAPESLHIAPKKFKVLIRDAEASKVIGRLYKVLHKIDNQESARPIKAAADFLTKFSALPSSLDMLLQWLDERQADMRFRDQFLWAAHKANLLQFSESGLAGSEKDELNKTRQAADNLVTNYQKGTAIAHALTKEVEAAATSSKHIAVVFTRPMLRTLAERFLVAQEFTDGRTFESFRQRIKLLLTSELGRAGDQGWADRYIFVGVDDEAIRFLVSDNHVLNESRLLLTYRTGIYLLSTLRPIHELEEFRRFKPRIDTLFEQLAEHLNVDERSILNGDDFVMPSFNFNTACASNDSEHDAHAWRIELEDGQVLWRGETSYIYVYDPANEHAVDSGFRAVETQSLQEGSRVFVMSEDLKELVEDYLKKAGMTVSSDKPFETALRQYHELVMRNLAERFPGRTRTSQIDAIRAHILQQHPEITDFPQSIGHWISLGASPNTPFEELRPHAPRKFPHYKAFVEALGFDATQTIWYWQCAIHPIRVNRRSDGRFISDIYSKILFDPESAIVHSGLSRKVTDVLYEKARENVYTVVSLQPPEEEKELP